MLNFEIRFKILYSAYVYNSNYKLPLLSTQAQKYNENNIDSGQMKTFCRQQRECYVLEASIPINRRVKGRTQYRVY